jgi:polysaccharide biosynthesis/export protein
MLRNACRIGSREQAALSFARTVLAITLAGVGLAGCNTTSGDAPKGDATAPISTPSAQTYATGAADASGAGDDELAKIAAKYAPAAPGPSAYRVGPQDILEITVFNVPQLSRISQVADDGTINYPLIGTVQASGKTTREIEADMTKRLGARYLQSPQVSVVVKEYNSQRVTVEGEVKKPGVFPIKGGTTLVQAIALAEGVSNETASSTVLVFRNTTTGRSVAKFELNDIREGKSDDPWVQQGDTIVVESSQAKVTFNYFTKVLPAAGLFRPF